MRSIAFSALCFLSFAVGASPVAFAQGPSSGQIPPGSRVVIAPMGGFETYFAAAVREKEVPIILTLDKDSAQYFVVSTETEWQGFVYGSAANAYASSSAASSTRGLVWTYLGLGETAEALQWLETALAERDPFLGSLMVFPGCDAIRDQTQFKRLAEQLKLPT